MKYNVYSIRDAKTGFLTPTIDINDDSAIRNFQHACTNVDSLFFTHPADYSLIKIGEFDVETGSIIQVPHEVLAYAPSKKGRKNG